jgi:hypothetical protein
MGQAPEGPLRVFSRQSCYPLKSRRDRIGGQWFRGLSLQQFRAPAPLFPPRGPSGRFPRFTGTIKALRLPTRPSRLASLPSLGGTALTPVFALTVAGACGREPGLLIAGRPSSMTPRKRWGLPGSWTDPCMYAALSDPGEISMPGHNGVSILPVPSLRRRLPRRRSFRGSITRLARLLSTLRGAGCPALHARLASGWWPAFAGQGSHLLGPLRKVSGAGYVIPPPFPRLAWRNVNWTR